ncbi:hypothetical protein NPIL_270171 [Nephila pilipes]|uniref:Uncharacterized protein n=1 Tax=Nephila pilipes TaxID=299642 RepID=A0A8X6I764_NEPPI|nr:hypothetical protein NPIL_270171 [Nephila pilipes]
MANGSNDKNRGYIIQWKIENASFLWQRQYEPLASPDFTVDSIRYSIWNLELYPRGIEKSNDIGCKLRYTYTKEIQFAPSYHIISYEISILAVDGSILITKSESSKQFSGIGCVAEILHL